MSQGVDCLICLPKTAWPPTFILDCASCHDYACVFTMLFASFPFASLVSFRFVPVLWGFVRLRPFVFFMDSFFFLAGFQARWPLPSISLLSLLASFFVLSLCCATYHLFIKPPKLPCQPLTFSSFLASHYLAMLPLLLSPSYSVVSCSWSWRSLHDGQDYVGISQYLLFN